MMRGMDDVKEFIRKHIVWLALAAVLVLSLLALSPLLSADFTNWDDDIYFTGNAAVKTLSWHSVKSLFSGFHQGLYKPLVLLSFAVEYYFFGMNPHVSHIINLVFHLVNCCLVFLLVRRMFGKTGAAFAIALLFGVHPMHVESVAWIAERKDMLYSFFFLISLLGYQKYLDDSSAPAYWTAVSSFAVSLFAKPMGVTLPAMLLLMDYRQKRPLTRRIVLDKIPFVLGAGIFASVAYFSVHTANAVVTHKGFSALDNMLVGFYGLMMYLLRFFVPAGLSCLYPYPVKTGAFLPWQYVAAPFVSLGMLGAAACVFRKNRNVMFGLAFFMVSVFLGLQWIPLAPSVAFDHYSYISYIGLFIVFYEWYTLSDEKVRPGWRWVFGAASAIFFCLTFARASVWQDSIRLWTNVLDKYPGNSTALNNRSVSYLKRGANEKALADISAAIASEPDYADAYVNKGAILALMRREDEALAEYRKAVSLKPTLAHAYVNIGQIYMSRGDENAAFEEFNRAVYYGGTYLPDAYLQRGTVYVRRGEINRALSDFYTAVRLDPSFEGAYINIGHTYLKAGDYHRAAAAYDKASRLNPSSADNYFNKGVASTALGDYQAAVAAFSSALALRPDDEAALLRRAEANAQLNRTDTALADFSAAIKAGAGPDAHRGRGALYSRAGKFGLAMEDFNIVLSSGAAVWQDYSARAGAYYYNGEWKKAAADFSRAMQMGGNNAQNMAGRAKALEQSGDLVAALADYDRALKLDPGYAKAWFGRAVVLRTQKRFVPALEAADRAASLAPGTPEILLERGLIKFNFKGCGFAADDLAAGVRSGSRYPPAAPALSECLKTAGG